MPPHAGGRPGRARATASSRAARTLRRLRGPRPARAAAPGEGPLALACPICFAPMHDGRAGPPAAGENLVCPSCRRAFPAAQTAAGAPYWDLTLEAGFPVAAASSSAAASSTASSTPRARKVQKNGYRDNYGAGTTMFQTQLVSSIYERGWRQSFASNGFPGPDAEYAKCLDAVARRCDAQGPLLDLSCGSGLFTRRFCREFPSVAALDFSKPMLEQTASYLAEEDIEPPILLRGDAGRLPLPNDSLAVVHAGAAIHCWPDPQAAVAEISRVLKPGGVFFASTFLYSASPLGELLGNDDLVQPLIEAERQAFKAGGSFMGGGSSNFRWWEEKELRALTERCGLEGFERELRTRRCILFSAVKIRTGDSEAAEGNGSVDLGNTNTEPGEGGAVVVTPEIEVP